MNWYKKAFYKQSSVTFWIEGADKITQPMNKLEVCSDLSKFIIYEMKIGQKLGIGWQDVDPDMSSGTVFAPTGQINIYLKNPNIKSGIIENIVDQYNSNRTGLIKLKFLEINKSGARDINVARVLVEENNTTNLEKLPEINIANANSVALIQLLQNEGMSNLDPYGGTLNIDELKAAIKNIEDNDFTINTYTQEPTEEKTPGQAAMYDHGRSYSQLSSYIDRLKNMISYIEENNLPVKKINYG